jgi:hypothetical protein
LSNHLDHFDCQSLHTPKDDTFTIDPGSHANKEDR